MRAEVDQLAGLRRIGLVAEIEFELPVLVFLAVGQCHLGDEGPARLGAEALEWSDLFVTQELFDLGQLEGAARRDLGERETAGVIARTRFAGAGVATVVFLHDAAAVGAGRGQRGVVARHGVAVVLLGLLDDALRHLRDLLHEGIA